MRTRRGLHTVVGAVIFTAVMISALSYVSYSLDLIGNFSETVIVEDSRQREKDAESFQITSVAITSSNKLNATIKNTGNIPVTLQTLWVDDQSLANDVKKYVVNKTIAPAGIASIGPSLSFVMSPTAGYDMKLVTQRGNTESFFVNSGTTNKLYYQVQVLPEEIPTGFSTTVLLNVINNMSSNSILYNIQPQMTATATVGSPSISLKQTAVPTSYPSLAPGDVAVFKYVYDISGNVGDTVKFTGNILNGVPGSNANATTTIAQIESAGTALTALGLSVTPVSQKNVMFFHGETTYTPAAEYRMEAVNPDQAGVTAAPSDKSMSFMSSNVTSDTTVAAGKYNVSLNYFSNLVPSGVPAPRFAFMFQCSNCDGGNNIQDSMGNVPELDDYSDPVFSASGGPDNKPYDLIYAPDDYHTEDWGNPFSTSNYPDVTPNTVMIWVRIPSTSDTYMTLIRWGDEGDSFEDEYEISFGDKGGSYNNRIYFMYTASPDSTSSTDFSDCVSNAGTDYDNNQWIQIVAVSPADDRCQLWINGVKQTDEDTVTNGGNTVVDADDYMAIGYDGANGSSEINADVAAFMYWDNTALSSTQIRDLYYTNYGTNGTRVYFKLDRVSSTGTILETLANDQYSLDFFDTTRASTGTIYTLQTANTTDAKYSRMNYTTSAIATKTFGNTERLKLTISWPTDATEKTQNLPINIRFDDNSVTTFPTFPSYIQTPLATPSWPTYNIIDDDNTEINYWLYNTGPYGAYFQYQGTRMILTNPSSTLSYAALPIQVNETDINEDQDSIFIAMDKYAKIDFWRPSNPPNDVPASGIVPPGLYNGSVYISGFDEGGRQFIRAIDMGSVRVTD